MWVEDRDGGGSQGAMMHSYANPPFYILQFSPVTDENHLEWETEEPDKRAERRARLQAFADTLGDEHASVRHQLQLLVPSLIDIEDAIVHLLSFEFEDNALPAQHHHNQALARMRSARRRQAKRVEMLKLARFHGWSAVKNYELRRKTGADKDLQQAIETAQKEKENSSSRKKDRRASTPYKRQPRQGRGWMGNGPGWVPPPYGLAAPVMWPNMESPTGAYNWAQRPHASGGFSGGSAGSKSSSSSTGQGQTSDLMCFRCGDTGHTRKFCRKRPE